MSSVGDPPIEVDDFIPTWYIGQHESETRALPITETVLRKSQEVGYDLLTTPISSPHFHSRVLTLLSNHLTTIQAEDAPNFIPAPIIPPFNAFDTPLSPSETVNQLVGVCADWIDIASPDPLIANVSRQVLNMEIAYAGFCGIANIIIPGPRSYNTNSSAATDGIVRYARAMQEALSIGGFMNIAISLPMLPHADPHHVALLGDLEPFCREEYKDNTPEDDQDIFSTWDAWNTIRTICKYSGRLAIALQIPKFLPTMNLQDRWFCEPLRVLSFKPQSFLANKAKHPVLSKSHQTLLSRYMRLKQSPWLLLCDCGPIPDIPLPSEESAYVSASASPVIAPGSFPSPTPAELSIRLKQQAQTTAEKIKAATGHLIYLRHLQRNQPARSQLERFGAGYQDYLQAPLQPLTDNLESVTYEVFEKDPVKYERYEAAIVAALNDWRDLQKPTSSLSGAVVVAVAGSGRGPLVTRALRASQITGVKVEVWAVEKNPNAYVLLQRHNEEDPLWNNQVSVVKSDMRAWRGPPVRGGPERAAPAYGKVDILVSELLGSFADNELSPECLDGVQHVLAPDGISIPANYTAHLSPISAPKLYADVKARESTDPEASNVPYVVMFQAIDFLATQVPDHPLIQQAWAFDHPLPPAVLALAEARRQGGVSGGGGGSMSGGDGANEHNCRYSRTKFVVRDRGVCHGIAGYFESILYDGRRSIVPEINTEDDGQGGIEEDMVGSIVEISTHPGTIEKKSRDMISWFPIYFPLKTPLFVPGDSEVEISIWRQTDDRKVWYEWVVEAFKVVGEEVRVRVGVSEVGSSRKGGCLM